MFHYTNVPLVEEWRGFAREGFSTSGILEFSPNTSKEPTITFRPDDVEAEAGRPHELCYTVRVEVSGLEAEDVILQSILYRLRQEYVDLRQTEVPDAVDFSQTAPVYPDLADPSDTHPHHTNWRIIEYINNRAIALDGSYDEPFEFTSGYRCPVRNRNLDGAGINSPHIYGLALDFDAGGDSDTTMSRRNWEICQEGLGLTPSPTQHFLYDQNGALIPSSLKPYGKPPNYPQGVTFYTKGHLDWR